jgi:hypothetical protein
MSDLESGWTYIGEFWRDGVKYRVYLSASHDKAGIRRIFPDPEDSTKPREVASGLDIDEPRFALPSNWSRESKDTGEQAIRQLVKHHMQQLAVAAKQRDRPEGEA